MKALRCAVVGVGMFGRWHVEKYLAHEGCELVAVVDRNSEVRARAQQTWGVKALESWEALPEVDAVSVATPAQTHYEVAHGLLQRGVHVLVEKPMVDAMWAADALVKEAQERGLVLQVGHIERFNPALALVGEDMCPPDKIECTRLTVAGGRGRDVDVVLDLMTHDIDLVLSLMGGREVDEVWAEDKAGGTGDEVEARVRFVGGGEAWLLASRVRDVSHRVLRVWRGERMVEVDLRPTSGVRYVGEPTPDPLREEIAEFVRCVRERGSPQVDGEQGRRVLALALAVMEQASA